MLFDAYVFQFLFKLVLFVQCACDAEVLLPLRLSAVEVHNAGCCYRQHGYNQCKDGYSFVYILFFFVQR